MRTPMRTPMRTHAGFFGVGAHVSGLPGFSGAHVSGPHADTHADTHADPCGLFAGPRVGFGRI